MLQEEVDYILDNFENLILPEERTAMVLLEISESEKDRSFWNLDLRYGKEESTKIEQLLHYTVPELRVHIASRILMEKGRRLLNRCPNCARLARTPTAMQCRYCGHDWH